MNQNSFVNSKKNMRVFINDFCNLNCHYCYHKYDKKNKERREMSAKNINKIINFLKANRGFKMVEFFGGEPFLSPKIIIRFIENLYGNYYFKIMTNGTVDISNFFKLIGDKKDKVVVNLSYDGLIQEKSRGYLNKNVILKNIDFMKKNDILFTINCVVSQESIGSLYSNVEYFSQIHDSFNLKRECMMGKVWAKENIIKLINILDKLVTQSVFLRVDKNFIVHHLNQIQYSRDEVGKSRISFVCQECIGRSIVIGMDAKLYLCEFCWADRVNCLGEFYELGKLDKLKCEYKKDGVLYNYCTYTDTYVPDLDEKLEQCRKKYHSMLNDLMELKNYESK